MFKVFNRKKKQVDLLENPISPVIVNELGGIGELTFSVPSTYKHLELEGYIQVENDHEYVIKEIVTHGTNRDVVCMLNIEEVLGMAWSKFISRDNTLMKCAELVLSGTRWRAIDNSSCNVKRNLYGTVTNSYNLLQMMCTVYNVEFIFDTYNKTVTFVDKVGKDAGVYFINDINLKQLNVDTHTHKYITRVIPVGKDGLTIESVNNGKNYLENKTYTTKNIYGIWQSDKHDDPSALKADAKRFLDEMAIPYETYEVVVDDLYALKGYDDFKYGLGDIVTIIDGDTETRIQQRIIQRTYNLLEPDKDTIHIANKDATFEDYYKRLQTIADMTQSVIGSDGSINGGSISDGTVSGDKLQSDSITSTHIKAEQILADHIMSNQITTNHLVANSITSDHIQSNTIDTKHLKSDIIQAEHIQANTIGANHIQANSITAGSGIIADGAIGNAQISKIDAGKIEAGTIDTSKVTIQGADGHLRLRGNRMQVFDGVGNQAKERVSVGDVNGDGTVYGLRVRGADGQTILLDENGVKSEGITDGAITNDKISEDANIDGAKLNINSVINKINTDGTEVIQGTKIEVDGTNLGVKLSEITNKQTSDGERITQAQAQITANQNAIKLKVDEQTYTTDKNAMTSKLEKNTSEISTMKGQIALKVEQTDINNAKNELTGLMDNKISSAKADIKVTTDAISQKVGKLETTTTTLSGKVDTANTNATDAKNIANTANNNANQALTQITTTNNKLASIESNVNGITSRVSNVENKQTTVDGKVSSLESRMSTAESKITEDAITNVVSKGFYSKDDIDSKGYQTASEVQQTVDNVQFKFTQSGGYNLLYNGDFKRGSAQWTLTNSAYINFYSDGLSSPNGRGVRMRGTQGSTVQINQHGVSVGYSLEPLTVSYYTYVSSSGSDGTTNPYRQGELSIIYEDDTQSWHGMPVVHKFDTWHKLSITVTPEKRVKSISMGLYCRDTTKMVYYSAVMVEKGLIATEWSPNPNEIHDGLTTIDRDGVTVRNGGLTIKNNAGTTVFSGDSDGNLTLAGNITSGATITGGALRSLNGDMYFNMNNGYMVLYNDGTRVGQTQKNKLSGYDIYGLTNGSEYHSYSCLAAKTSSSSSEYTAMVSVAGQDLVNYIKKGVNLGAVTHSHGYDFHLHNSYLCFGLGSPNSSYSTIGQLRWYSDASTYNWLGVTNSSYVSAYGQNGVRFGYRSSSSNTYTFAIESSLDSYNCRAHLWSHLNMHNYSLRYCQGVSTANLEISEPIPFTYTSTKNGEEVEQVNNTYNVVKTKQNIVESIGSITITDDMIDSEVYIELDSYIAYKDYMVILSPIGENRKVCLLRKEDNGFYIKGDKGVVDYSIKFNCIDTSIMASYKSIKGEEPPVSIVEEKEEPKPIILK